jgi:adenylate kinase
MLRLVLLGGPGSGKGTQAARLAEQTGARHISTGQLLRAEIAAGTELGHRVAAYLDAGELVPDDLLFGLVLPIIEVAGPSTGYLLDGFPRSKTQAQRLDAEVGRCTEVCRVVLLKVPARELVRRALGRGASQGRSDDTPEVIKHRLQVFERESSELIRYYRDRGLLYEVDAAADPDTVYRRIQAAL